VKIDSLALLMAHKAAIICETADIRAANALVTTL